MRNKLRIWSEHLAGPPCPAPFVQGAASRRGRFAGSRGNGALEAWEQRCGAGAEVPVHLGGGRGVAVRLRTDQGVVTSAL